MRSIDAIADGFGVCAAETLSKVLEVPDLKDYTDLGDLKPSDVYKDGSQRSAYRLPIVLMPVCRMGVIHPLLQSSCCPDPS